MYKAEITKPPDEWGKHQESNSDRTCIILDMLEELVCDKCLGLGNRGFKKGFKHTRQSLPPDLCDHPWRKESPADRQRTQSRDASPDEPGLRFRLYKAFGTTYCWSDNRL